MGFDFFQPVASLTNPQQVLPSAIVSVESQTLRDLVAGDNLALDSLVALQSCLKAVVHVLK